MPVRCLLRGGLHTDAVSCCSRRYERKVAAAKRKAIAKEMELQKLYLEQVHVKPKHVPFPEMTLSERLPRPTTKYPNVQVGTEQIPTIIGILCGTQVERYAAEEMVHRNIIPTPAAPAHVCVSCWCRHPL